MGPVPPVRARCRCCGPVGPGAGGRERHDNDMRASRPCLQNAALAPNRITSACRPGTRLHRRRRGGGGGGSGPLRTGAVAEGAGGGRGSAVDEDGGGWGRRWKRSMTPLRACARARTTLRAYGTLARMLGGPSARAGTPLRACRGPLRACRWPLRACGPCARADRDGAGRTGAADGGERGRGRRRTDVAGVGAGGAGVDGSGADGGGGWGRGDGGGDGRMADGEGRTRAADGVEAGDTTRQSCPSPKTRPRQIVTISTSPCNRDDAHANRQTDIWNERGLKAAA